MTQHPSRRADSSLQQIEVREWVKRSLNSPIAVNSPAWQLAISAIAPAQLSETYIVQRWLHGSSDPPRVVGTKPIR